MRAHRRRRRYSRFARIRRRLLAYAQAPTVTEQLNELRPRGNCLVMAASTAPAPLARPGARPEPTRRSR